MSEQKKELTASQRLMGLEQSVRLLDQALANMANQMEVLRNGMLLINDKQTAIVTALSTGQAVNNQSLDTIVEQQKVEDMKTKIAGLVANNQLKASTDPVDDMSFVVVREINKESGEVVNPRLQFPIRTLNKESMEKIVGKKAGDSVSFVDGNPAIVEIEEVYTIVLEETGEAEAAPEQGQ